MATSKLSAVNTLLSIIGEAPVNSLTPPLTGDTSLADSVIDETSREIQGEGLSWNTILYDKIPLDASNCQSQLPSNTLAVRFPNHKNTIQLLKKINYPYFKVIFLYIHFLTKFS